MSHIVVDVREKALRALLPEAETRTLIVGDVIISDGKLVIERKSSADISASIIDGRFQEQSLRLGQCASHVIYLIEGRLIDQRSITAVASLALHKNFCVLQSESVEQTAELIRALAKKSVTAEFLPVAHSYAKFVVSPVKKNNITRENMCEIMLSTVPGVGRGYAKIVAAVHPSIFDLVCAMRADSTCLDDLKVSNGKKLGSDVKRALYLYLA